MWNKILYALLYGWVKLHALLPMRALYFLSDLLYLLVYRIVGYRVKVTRRNLEASFPDRSTDELRKLERRFYHHFCDYIVDPRTKHARSQRLLDLSTHKLEAFYESHQGLEAKVLFEQTRKGGMMHGFTENYIKVEIPYDSHLVNETRRVTLGSWNDDRSALRATLISDNHVE